MSRPSRAGTLGADERCARAGGPERSTSLSAVRLRPAGDDGAALPRMRVRVRLGRAARPRSAAPSVRVRAPPRAQRLLVPPDAVRGTAAPSVLAKDAPDPAVAAAPAAAVLGDRRAAVRGAARGTGSPDDRVPRPSAGGTGKSDGDARAAGVRPSHAGRVRLEVRLTTG